ncbi:MAG: hypothetical protein BroJett040_05060 [Oligoflexia bacterium]|nr:MAG: hypothetical protein BroJett040_05060 [Oligoflexia bacterium]
MEIGKVNYFEKVETSKHQEFLQAHNNCILCGSTLELQHIRTEEPHTIKEEAHCPECEMRTRAKIYTLQ